MPELGSLNEGDYSSDLYVLFASLGKTLHFYKFLDHGPSSKMSIFRAILYVFWCLLTPFTDSTRDDPSSGVGTVITCYECYNTCPLLILSPSGTPSGQHAPTRDSCRTLSRPCTPAPLIAPFLPHPGTVIASSWWLRAFMTTYEPVPCRDVSPLLFPVVLLTASLTLVFHGGCFSRRL